MMSRTATISAVGWDCRGPCRRIRRSGSVTRFDGFDLEMSGQSLSHSLGVGWSRDVEERLSVSFQIGVFYRDQVVETVIADDVSVEESDVGIHGSFALDKTLEHYGLSFSASHRPSAGDVLVGTSTDTEVSFSLSPLYTDRWSWSLSLRYGHRVPDLADQNPLDSFEVGGLGAAISRA